MESVFANFWIRFELSISMCKTKADSVRNVARVEVAAAKRAALYECDLIFFIAREIACNSGASRTATNNDIVEIVFFAHPIFYLYIIVSYFS